MAADGPGGLPARDYTEIPDLAEVYLEDSWVLDVTASFRELALRIDAVLTPRHRLYSPAKPGEQHCYWPSTLVFAGVTTLSWTDQVGSPAIDATGELDHGHVDVMRFCGRRYHLDGDFGLIDLEADAVALTLHPEHP